MAHELASALQQAGRIRQRCAMKEPHVHVRGEYIDIAEGHISQTCNRTVVMQKLPDFLPAPSHHLKPLLCDGSQFTRMLFHPRINGVHSGLTLSHCTVVDPIGLEDWKAQGVPWPGTWGTTYERWVQMLAGMYRGRGDRDSLIRPRCPQMSVFGAFSRH